MRAKNKHIEHIRTILKALPNSPGVYQYLDEKGKIIYVGKAKKLKKRVSSYFQKGRYESGKVELLVRKVADIKTINVETEFDALLLENNLIKKLQPKYNINLKDDKTYPWICIKNEPFPRIFTTRNVIHDGSKYFGPYASVRMVKTLLDLARQLYPLRTCKHILSEQNIKKGKFEVCLEYHIKNCLGPCEGLQSKEEYSENIQQIQQIIKGNTYSVVKELKKRMADYAGEMQFEKAQFVKEKIELLEKYQSKSTVVSTLIHNVDVFSIITDEKAGYVNYFKVINGAIIQSHTIELKKKLDETAEELLAFAITDFRQRFESNSHEIIVPFGLDLEIPSIKITVPQRGDKKHLLELSERNAKYYKLEKQKQQNLVDPERHTKRILEQMQKDLRLQSLPAHIECFDNSNTQGSYPVAAMVVFKNAKPSKSDYRHFNIKTVEGPNDFASMEEVVYRRYKRLRDEKQPMPQLVIVDGGKGQLSSAVRSLNELGLRGKITIIGIAKKLEEIYYPEDPIPLYIDKKSETLKIIQQLRDEAHRFGITHHRKRREKGAIKSELLEIPGIGFNTAQKLMWKFKSVKNTKNASEQELADTIGKAKAKIVVEYFLAQKSN